MRICRNRGQAAIELAVFGTIMILVLSTLVTYGQRLEMQNQLKMEAFRKALQKAYEKNSSVSYSLKKDTRLASLSGGWGQGQATSLSSTASVMWQMGQPGAQGAKDEQSFAFYEINGMMIGDPDDGLPREDKVIYDAMGGKQEAKMPVNVYRETSVRDESYSTSFSKREAGGIVANARSSQLQDTLATTIYTRFDTSEGRHPEDDYTPAPQYEERANYETGGQGLLLNEENRYEYNTESVGNVISRSRSWSTPVQ